MTEKTSADNVTTSFKFPLSNPVENRLDSGHLRTSTKVSFNVPHDGDDVTASTRRCNSPLYGLESVRSTTTSLTRTTHVVQDSTYKDTVMDPQKAPLDERVWVDYVAKDSVWTTNTPSASSLLRMPRLPTWEEVEQGYMPVERPRNIAEKNFYVVDFKIAYATHVLPLYEVDLTTLTDEKIVLHLEPDEEAPINVADRVVTLGYFNPIVDPQGYKERREGPPIQGVHYYLKQSHHFSAGKDLSEIRLGYRIGEPVFPLPKSKFIKADPDYATGQSVRTIFGGIPSKHYYPMLCDKYKRKGVCKVKIVFGEPPLPDNGVSSPWYPFNFNKADCMNGDPFSRRGMVQPTAMKCPIRSQKKSRSMMRMTNTGIYPDEMFCEFGIYTLDEEGLYHRCDQDMGNRKFETPDALKAQEINFDHYQESVEFEPYLGSRELKRYKRVSKYPWKAVLKDNFERVIEQRRKFVEQPSSSQGIDCTKLTMVDGVIYWYWEPYETYDHTGPNQRSGGDHELAKQLFAEQKAALELYKQWKKDLANNVGELPKYKLQIADELNIAPFGHEAKQLDILRTGHDYAVA